MVVVASRPGGRVQALSHVVSDLAEERPDSTGQGAG